MSSRVFLTIDLGAESGRAVAGVYNDGLLEMVELHRFANGPMKAGDTLRWDVRGIFDEVKIGIGKAAETYGSDLVSVGVDTWGVDYALLDENDELVTTPYNYRDSRTDGMQEEACRRVPAREIYDKTGIQFVFFNTLFQLLSEVVTESESLARAKHLLFMPDLINFWLTGVKANELTIASTSQLLDPRTGKWACCLMEQLGIPTDIFCEVIEPGTNLGGLLADVRKETGAGDIAVVAPGCHDTASAVAAVPAGSVDHAFLSSGTWSLMGIESQWPVINDISFENSLNNECGVCDTITLLKNLTGMWIIQECRRVWAEQGESFEYEQLAEMAREAPAFRGIIDPDHASFTPPGDMPARIVDYCRNTGQVPPASKGETIRWVVESLALKYRSTFEVLGRLAAHRLETLHIVGGGTKNELLNSFAANAIGCPVITGPIEATSVGNILMQMMATGEISTLREGRDLVRRSLEMEAYEPQENEAWNEAYGRFCEISARA